jgi:hypothetical protein
MSSCPGRPTPKKRIQQAIDEQLKVFDQHRAAGLMPNVDDAEALEYKNAIARCVAFYDPSAPGKMWLRGFIETEGNHEGKAVT